MAGLPPGDMGRIDACLALAGATEPTYLAAARQHAHPFRRVAITSDVRAALIGAHGGRDGGVVMVGTGSIGLAAIGDAKSGWADGDFPCPTKAAAPGSAWKRCAACSGRSTAGPSSTPLLDELAGSLRFGPSRHRALHDGRPAAGCRGARASGRRARLAWRRACRRAHAGRRKPRRGADGAPCGRWCRADRPCGWAVRLGRAMAPAHDPRAPVCSAAGCPRWRAYACAIAGPAGMPEQALLRKTAGEVVR